MDPAASATEKLIKRLEKRIKAEFKKANDDVVDKFLDYMKRFAVKDKIKSEAVKKGLITPQEYALWRQQQVFVGKRWDDLVDKLAADYFNAHEIAKQIAINGTSEAWAENNAWYCYAISQQVDINATWTIFSPETVERLIRDDPQLLPSPSAKNAAEIAKNKAMQWNRQKITSAIVQGVSQGESIPKIARRLESVSNMNHKQAVRNARTMMTAAQNAGRIDAGLQARELGVETTNVWLATLDMRTRHEHRELDGQRRGVAQPFVVPSTKDEILYPGDPNAKAQLVYNCRCTLVPQVAGFEYNVRGLNTDYRKLWKEGLNYQQWKASNVEKPNPILLPEQKAAAIRGSYIKQYVELRKKLNGV